MKIKSFSILALAAALCCTLGSSTASAVFITITEGNPGNAGTDNVLFNDGSLLQSGVLVQGTINGNPGFIVDFTSASNDNQLQVSGGQASIKGLGTNDPFTSLTFGLQSGATFTKAILNPDATNGDDGNIDFSVSYIDAAGSPFTDSFSLSGNGQNFFGIEAGMGARITTVTFSTADSSFADSNQIRLGGIAAATRVPEGGMTLLLLGASLAGVESLRRRFVKR